MIILSLHISHLVKLESRRTLATMHVPNTETIYKKILLPSVFFFLYYYTRISPFPYSVILYTAANTKQTLPQYSLYYREPRLSDFLAKGRPRPAAETARKPEKK